jgi:TolB protein
MRTLFWIGALGAAALLFLNAQTIGIGTVVGAQKVPIAIPQFRGSGEAQNFMGAFNDTLRKDIEGAGMFKVISPSMYPAFTPQQPSDFVTPPPVQEQPRRRRAQVELERSGGGKWMADWSGPPVNAKYLAFGYTAVTNGVLVLRGYLYDVTAASSGSAQVIGKNYLASTVDEKGARDIAHQFAADIIALFGGQSLFGSHIYFVSTRTGHKEIWMMDPDGGNQKQITKFGSISIQPAVSPDGTKIVFTSFHRINPGIFVFSVDPVRDLRFYNQRASVNSSPSFTPDGKQIIYSSSAPNDVCCRIFLANLDGSGFRPITTLRSIDTEPKVNPKTGTQIVFVSGRSGPQQIYEMNLDGSDLARITDGTGEASNPAWHPDGQHIAFSWTRGFAAGKFNVFVMDVASHQYTQLTHDEGRNENPSWAPDGVHLVFASTRSGRSQIYTMLADGSKVTPLTTQGNNYSPVWGK